MRQHITIYIYILIAIISLEKPCFAQNNLIEELTIDDGLSQGMIQDMIQDRQGFMWFSTSDGLNRYDGYSFKVYTHKLDDEFSISDNKLSNLFVDSRGYIWVISENGFINVYNDLFDKFFNLPINQIITAINEDKNGFIWIGTTNGDIYKINAPDKNINFKSQNEFIKATFINKLSFKTYHRINSIHFDSKNTPLLFSAKGYYKPVNNNFIYQEISCVNDNNRRFYRDNTGQFWFTTKTAIYRTDLKKITYILEVNLPYTFNDYDEYKILISKENNVSVFLDSFYWVINNTIISKNKSLRLSLSNAQNLYTKPEKDFYHPISKVFEDRFGNIWVGTGGYGVKVFNFHQKKFKTFLKNTSVGHLIQDKFNKLYVSKYSSYYLLDTIRNKLNPIPNLNYKGLTQTIIQDYKGFFWVIYSESSQSDEEIYLLKYDPNWKFLYKKPLGIKNGVFSQTSFLFRTVDNNLWIYTRDCNLIYYNTQKDDLKKFNFNFINYKNSLLKESTALFVDTNGLIWLGSRGGLIKAQFRNGKLTFKLYSASKQLDSLKNNWITSICQDTYNPHKYLWLTTRGGGIVRLNKLNNCFQHFTTSQGLSDNVTYGIIADKYQQLWISTNKGINKFDLKGNKFYKYDKNDGLQEYEFNTNSFHGNKGKLFFGGVSGINVIVPSIEKNNTAKPILKIVGIKINNTSLDRFGDESNLRMSVEYTNSVSLNYNQNNIDIDIALVDYVPVKKRQYRYMLNNPNSDWIYLGTNHNIVLLGLSPNEYNLLIQGSIDGNIWSDSARLSITIKPPFYKSWFAYFIYLLLFLLLTRWFFNQKTERELLKQKVIFERKESERLEYLNNFKNNFYTNISHEFRTPLTLIIGLAEQLRKVDKAKSSLITRNAEILLKYVNQILDLSKVENNMIKINLTPLYLNHFLTITTASFESLAMANNINFEIKLLQDEQIVQGDVDILTKIINNLLSNAFKFTPQGGLITFESKVVLISEGTLNLEIIISDTGIGISSEHLNSIFERFYTIDKTAKYEGTGVGLSLVKELLKVINGEITFNSSEAIGTTVTIKIPFEKTPSDIALKFYPTDSQLSHPKDKTHHNEYKPISDLKLSSEKKSVLIIDDNKDMRYYIGSLFRPTYDVLFAENGLEGFNIAAAKIPDVIISDLMMPEVDGYQLCKKIKSEFSTSHIPVIMLTAKATLQDKIVGLNLGADEYLNKPFNQEELITRVNNLLSQRDLLKEYYKKNIVNIKGTEIIINDPFLKKAIAIVETNLHNSTFGVELFSDMMGLSKSQLFRKIKALSNLTPVDFLRELRLKKAADLLIHTNYTIADIASQVGISSPPYFAKAFQEKFGVTPSEFRKRV